MNDIAQLICDYVDYELFYELKDDYKLSEKLYWKNKELPDLCVVVESGYFKLTKYLVDIGKCPVAELSTEYIDMSFDCAPIHYGDCFVASKCTQYSQEYNMPISYYVIAIACYHGHLDIVEYLYLKGHIFYEWAIDLCRYQPVINFLENKVVQNIPDPDDLINPIKIALRELMKTYIKN